MRAEMIDLYSALDILERRSFGLAEVMARPAIIAFCELRPVFRDHRIVGSLRGFDFLVWKRFGAETRLAPLVVVGRALRFDGFVRNIALRHFLAVGRDKGRHDCDLVHGSPPRHGSVSKAG